MLLVAHHGVAAAEFGGPTVPLMVITNGAVPHHGDNVREDPLVVEEQKERGAKNIIREKLIKTHFLSKEVSRLKDADDIERL